MTAIRFLILLSLGTIATYLIFSEPAADSGSWLTTLLLSKAAGVLTASALLHLQKRWFKPSQAKRIG